MAVRVENTGIVNFGTLTAETTVTHARLSVGAQELVTRQLAAPRTVDAGGQLQFNVNEIDLLFPSNVFENAGYSALLAFAFNGINALKVDILTDANTVVATQGYVSRNVTGWRRTTEAD